MKRRPDRVLVVCSSGGHLDQALLVLPALPHADIAIATFDKPDARDKTAGYRTYPLAWPTNRNIPNLLRNTWRAVRILRRERPAVIVSTGAAAAVPFFYLGRWWLRAFTVYLECYDRISLPTLTSRLVRPVTSQYLAQWPTQLAGFPRRTEVPPSQ